MNNDDTRPIATDKHADSRSQIHSGRQPEGQGQNHSSKRHQKPMSKGAKNLVLLGIGAVLVAATTTGVSLAIYHHSGDIYLDRSRPGYLPDEEEIVQQDNTPVQYELDKTGKIDTATLDEYLENLDTEVKAIDAYTKPFAPEALSDERLGIPTE